MNIETRKLNIISWVSELKDERTLSKIEQLKPPTKDWWERISEDEKTEIEEGLTQADNDEVKTTEEVLGKYKRWVGNHSIV